MHLTSVICPRDNCNDEIAFAATRCAGCGHTDVGYPNVRYANDPAEVAALEARVRSAFTLADADGSRAVLDEFERACTGSTAVTVMAPVDLLSIVSGNKLWVSFYKQSRDAGSRVAEANKWDMNRSANDGKVNPQYYGEITYAALSLTDCGSGWYGGCHVSLIPDRIAVRATVFWQNPFSFLKDPPLAPDEIVPPGYRASWPRRAELAVAKLHSKIHASTTADEFADILLEDDPGRGDTDFIEVHIFGAVAPTAFAKVTVDVSRLDEDQELDWDSVKRRLAKKGIPILETSLG